MVTMTPKQLIKLLEKNGWEFDRANGSHYIMKKDDLTEVVPLHKKDIPGGLLNAILKRNGLK
jgi:predicted RNA binding protein YcfA (HicA-like mRNA interferase family)